MEVGITYHPGFTHCSFTFSRFFGEDVAFERLLVGDFSCTGNFEAFFCATVCFYLWHLITVISYSLLAPRGLYPGTFGALWEMFK